MTRAVVSPIGVRFSGHGLFSSLCSTATVRPDDGEGIRWRRMDLPDQPWIPAHVRHVLARPRHTVLAVGGAPGVHTIEHLMSALVACGIARATVELDGPEVPLLDGSAAPFVEGLLDAGVAPQRSSDPIVVRAPIELADGVARIIAEPIDGPRLELNYHLDYGPDAGATLGPQHAAYTHEWSRPDPRAFLREIAPARTFCTTAEGEQFRAAGFFAHLSPTDVLVIAPGGPVGTTLRFPNEPSRHKVLDMLGDLALAGRPIHARITAHKAGHALNHAMARALLERA